MTQAENSRNTEQPASGPAFPCHPDVIPRSDRDYAGMTLRDYFAAKAMQGMAGSHAYCERGWDQADLAGQAYEIADAMLKARNHSVGQSENDRRVAACLDARKQRDELREALQALVDAAWLEDSHAVRFDGTVMFSPGYDFSGIDGGRRAEFREEGIEFVVWPAGGAGGNWSAYSTYDGSLWFERFETEDEAREQCMKLLDQVMPDHPISKARAALAKAGEPR